MTDLSTTGGNISTILLSTAFPTNLLIFYSLKFLNLERIKTSSAETETHFDICDIYWQSCSGSEWVPLILLIVVLNPGKVADVEFIY